jgi:hypothetical protein
MFLALSVVVSWLWIRPDFVDISTPSSVAVEWAGLVGLMISSLYLPVPLGKNFRMVIALSLSVLIIGSVWSSEQLKGYPHYWAGFGPRVAFATIVVSAVWLGFEWLKSRSYLRARSELFDLLRPLEPVIGVAAILWTLPTLMQPMDSLLNVGDSTEKTLDEITGWVVGNVPAVDSSWVHGALLGLPLAPLQFIDGHGEWKTVIVMLYVNGLLLAVPVIMASIVRLCLPTVSKYVALSITMTSVSISGQPINTSVFQELSFLARGWLPLVLGFVTVKVFGKSHFNCKIDTKRIVFLGSLAGVTLLNNYEYGVGAAFAAMAVGVVVSPSTQLRLKQVSWLLVGFGTAVGAFLALGALRGGNWIGRRLGVWYDVLLGQGGQHSNSAGSPIPGLGLPSLYFALIVTGIAVGLRCAAGNSWRSVSAAGATSLYFGVWSLMSSPYFINGGGAGAFRTQFLMIPVTLLVTSIVGLARFNADGEVSISPIGGRMSIQWWSAATKQVERLPVILLCSALVVSILQVPNGVREWRRVQTPQSVDRHLDEWSPERLDWIRPERVLELVAPFGGESEVGWWFSYGNAVELLTGVENLLGTTGWETMRSESQSKLGCEPLLRSPKRYVITLSIAKSQIEKCRGEQARAVTLVGEDGLVVFEFLRQQAQ